jgi:hypothetical protein
VCKLNQQNVVLATLYYKNPLYNLLSLFLCFVFAASLYHVYQKKLSLYGNEKIAHHHTLLEESEFTTP